VSAIEVVAQTVGTRWAGVDPLLDLSQVFTLLFVVMGPPLKTPLVFFSRTQAYDRQTRRRLALRTSALSVTVVLVGGFLGMALQRNWQISTPAMLMAGGLIFLIVSLRTVLEQYHPVSQDVHPAPRPSPPAIPAVPSAFELAVPMIVTPYGLGGLILLLASSHSTQRTVGILVMLTLVMVLHHLAMVFAGPIVRGIGPLPFKLFGVCIGALTVGLAVQMLVVGIGMLELPN
jgi:multiple antibiotic resistance protein